MERAEEKKQSKDDTTQQTHEARLGGAGNEVLTPTARTVGDAV